MKIPRITAKLATRFCSSDLGAYEIACFKIAPPKSPRWRTAGVTMQGCTDYTLSDLTKIKDANPVSCSTLGGQRAQSCTADHDDVQTYCGTTNCLDQKRCLDARIKTMAHFDAAVKELVGCKATIWTGPKNKILRERAAEAIENLLTGQSGHQRAIKLVNDWIKDNCS